MKEGFAGVQRWDEREMCVLKVVVQLLNSSR